MLKYLFTIKEIHEMKEVVAFHYYDVWLRDLRKGNCQPWQKPLDELYNRALHRTSNFHQGRNNALCRNNRSQRPCRPSFSRDKVCFAYNRKEYCEVSTCPYRHVCKICRGPHPLPSCPRKATRTKEQFFQATQSAQPSIK